MKYFKHDSDSSLDAKLQKVIIKYGMEGYGLYWLMIEMIARNVNKNNLTFELEHDAEIIGSMSGIHVEKVQEMVTYFVSLNLFDQNQGIIRCLKLATRTDEYTQKLLQSVETVGRLSGESRETVGRKSNNVCINRTEQKRREEKREAPDVPPHIPPNLWADYIAYRKSIRKPMSAQAQKLAITALTKLHNQGYNLEAIVNRTIMNGWTSFHERPEDKSHPKTLALRDFPDE